jgi:serine/threonine protein kinase
MQEQFDPYHKWLAIPPQEQPPDHYRLLGIARFEADPDVIANAADQRMIHLRGFQTGPRAADSQRLLNEVAAARVTLLDPGRRAGYDALLRSAVPADAQPLDPRSPSPDPRSPAAAKPAAGLRSGQAFGGFRLTECLRQSKFAGIYRAEEIETGRCYSLKLLTTAAAADETLCKRFRREIELTTRINHPNLVAGYTGGQWDEVWYLVTEYVVGSDLQTLVAQGGPLPVDQAVEYVSQAAQGLGQLHQLQVVHRNVSPKNLLVDIQGRIKVTNLMLARVEEGSEMAQGEALTRMGDTMGTAEYMAPEQAANPSGVDQRADIYALGCTLCFLLTGGPVYPGKSMMEKLTAHRKQPIPSLKARRPDVPDWLDLAFQKMIAKDPAQRYASMEEVCQSLLPVRKPSPWSSLLDLVSRAKVKLLGPRKE